MIYLRVFIILSLLFVGSASHPSYAMTELELKEHLEHLSTLEDLDVLYSSILGDRSLSLSERKTQIYLIRSHAEGLLDDHISRSFEGLTDPSLLSSLYVDLKDLVTNRYRHFFAMRDKYALDTFLNAKFRPSARAMLDSVFPESSSCRQENWYPCRGEGCKNGKLLKDGDLPYFQCVVCGYEACLRCGGISEHSDCAQYEEVLRVSAEAGLELKPCPNCKSLVSKDGGCDRMTCTCCGKQWEWSTGKTGKDLSIEHRYVEYR